MSGYEEDLAYIHDAGFDGWARAAAEEMLECLRAKGIEEGVVAELGCGSGTFAGAMARGGFAPWGVDLSPAMVEMCRRRVPAGNFRVGSFLDAQLPSSVALAAVGEVLNYAFDSRAGAGVLGEVFARIHEALVPGGVLLFDVAVPGRGAGPAARHFEEEDWALLLDLEETERLLTRTMTVFRREGALFRRSRETHRLHLYTTEEVRRELEAAGFRVEVGQTYGKMPAPAGLAVFRAFKEEKART